ncbi:hypothetical protein B2G88_13925 [Natronolimnobius baerhuensis]|uniref:Uncharacterized protein n=1 Tax=Natronolimnobius baerhuensis TaxID=253108 RepID=A0A202E6Y4_9EURY|nr:hypothetical protein B2G88_13925 [Natronolimnobius baerhuensis]
MGPRSQSVGDSKPKTRAAESDAPLAHRIERTKLQTQVTALERTLKTSEERQYDLITQYERLLAERTDDTTQDDNTMSNKNETDGLLCRLLKYWR